jgi:hypothetical protein
MELFRPRNSWILADPFRLSSVVIADVNGDGRLDIVIGNTCPASRPSGCLSDATVGLLLGKGNGTFFPVANYDSVQVALMKVMRLLLANAIPYKTAGLLFYGLQTASANLARMNFQPTGEQVATIPFTVPIHSPHERSGKKDPLDDASPTAEAESDEIEARSRQTVERARKN